MWEKRKWRQHTHHALLILNCLASHTLHQPTFCRPKSLIYCSRRSYRSSVYSPVKEEHDEHWNIKAPKSRVYDVSGIISKLACPRTLYRSRCWWRHCGWYKCMVPMLIDIIFWRLHLYCSLKERSLLEICTWKTCWVSIMKSWMTNDWNFIDFLSSPAMLVSGTFNIHRAIMWLIKIWDSTVSLFSTWDLFPRWLQIELKTRQDKKLSWIFMRLHFLHRNAIAKVEVYCEQEKKFLILNLGWNLWMNINIIW